MPGPPKISTLFFAAPSRVGWARRSLRHRPVRLAAPGRVSVVGLPYLIAQKFHACTEVFEGEENARVHNLMDLLLARDLLGPADLKRTREACGAIFDKRAKQSWPPAVTVYPSWAQTFARIAEEETYPITDVEEAAALVSEFIDEIDAAL
jgi:hypothetical protein